MDYAETYQQMYVTILGEHQQIVGSGIAYDDCHIITCAHVVNAALKLDKKSLLTQKGKKIQVAFALNNLFAKEVFEACVEVWFPTDEFSLKNDLAILLISKHEALQENLRHGAKDVEFIDDRPSGIHEFKLFGIDARSRNLTTIQIEGAVGDYVSVEGKTQLNPREDIQPFLQAGFSGSPVFSKNLNGIIGLAQSIKRYEGQETAKSGFMIDARRIAELVDTITPKPRGIGVYRSDKLKLIDKILVTKIRSLCDRDEIIDDIRERIYKQYSNPIQTFIVGKTDRQEGVDFKDRYEIEFIDPEFVEGDYFSISLKLPNVFALERFQSEILAAFKKILSSRLGRVIAPEKFNKHTFYSLITEKLVKRYVLLIINFELEEITPDHKPCLEWLNSNFLNLKAINKLIYPCHVLFVGNYNEDYPGESISIVEKAFDLPGHKELKNVPYEDIRSWVENFKNHRFKNALSQKFVNQGEYSMRKIFEAYDATESEIGRL